MYRFTQSSTLNSSVSRRYDLTAGQHEGDGLPAGLTGHATSSQQQRERRATLSPPHRGPEGSRDAPFAQQSVSGWPTGARFPMSGGLSLSVHTATGMRTVRSTTGVMTLCAPRCGRPDRLAPLLAGATILLGCVPIASAAKINAAVRLFRNATAYFEVHEDDIDFTIFIAIIMMRACPPVGTDIPAEFGARPVLPSSAAADIDNMRRAARERMQGMEKHLDALKEPRVSSLLKAIGSRVHKLRTEKRALLFEPLRSFVDAVLCNPAALASDIRDAFALCVAFFFGCRISELLAFNGEHINPIELGPGPDDDAIKITFVSIKTRQSLFQTHQPWEVFSAHSLLLRAFDRFNEAVRFLDGRPVFHSIRGRSTDRLSADWFAKLIKRIDPALVPHSARVGLATEMWACGGSVDEIMAAGRWTSPAAVLYIVGSLDKMVVASRGLGKGMLRYTEDGLRQQIGVSAAFADAWRAKRDKMVAARWSGRLAAPLPTT